MKTTITKSQFIDAINKAIPGTFSPEGAGAIFDYLREIEKDTGLEYELDPIGVRCTFTEYDSLGDLLMESGKTSIKEMDDLVTVLELPSGKVLTCQ